MVPTEGFFLDDEPLPAYIREKMLYGEEPVRMIVEESDLKMQKQ
jgi:hypothetical protein